MPPTTYQDDSVSTAVVDDSDDENGGQDDNNDNDNEILQEALKLVKELKAQEQMPLKCHAIENDGYDNNNTPAMKKKNPNKVVQR